MSMQVTAAPPANDATSYLDLGITLALDNWPALTLAVQSNWGGPTSDDKRAWLCGAISEMLAERPETDAEDLEDVLIQVMNDEFDVVIDDESAAAVAVQIMDMKQHTIRGEFTEIQEMWEAYQRKSQQKSASAAMFKKVDTKDEDQETDDESDEEDDVEMGDAPALVRAPREKAEPEIDDDGFTMVKKKR
jgi:pre-rRNA-processing protein TSR2